ncbi:F-box/LRR-repeat protein [Quillaja saponaria]|uniref:F-box/LRR-repeat protein n=1 Tax=Quillaja saponaria TaxID=32244 RepID=A0AAD7LS65_QUISA|nr:F-box/LRR-repeat protein [Quillaja saponaria]
MREIEQTSLILIWKHRWKSKGEVSVRRKQDQENLSTMSQIVELADQDKEVSATGGDRTTFIDLNSESPGGHSESKWNVFIAVKGSSCRTEGKQDQEGLNNMDQKVALIDLISQMPDPIIHHILSLLRSAKDVARTSILSKRWRYIWYSFSVLIFDQWKILAQGRGENRRDKNQIFKDYVNNSMQVHLEQYPSIQKLVLHMTSCDLELVPHINSWISFAAEKNVKELDLHVGFKNNRCYILPQTASSAKTITGLRIFGCSLKTDNNIELPYLQKLYLRKLEIEQQIVQNLISNYPLIKDLRLIHCTGLKHLQVSHLQLDRVEVHNCNGLKQAVLNIPCLQTFWYCGKKFMSCKINSAGCRSLKRLTLEDASMTDEFFQNYLTNFPVLEKLYLNNCSTLHCIMISSPRLERLVLRECNNLVKAEMDGPNLLSIEYKGEEMLPFFSVNHLCLKDVKLFVETK